MKQGKTAHDERGTGSEVGAQDSVHVSRFFFYYLRRRTCGYCKAVSRLDTSACWEKKSGGDEASGDGSSQRKE